MIIYSEKTKEKYNSIEACEKAEKEFDEAQAKAEKKKNELAEVRKTRAEEVENAYKESIEAHQKFVDLMQKFVDDYGSFHMTYSNDKEHGNTMPPMLYDPFEILNLMLNSPLL